MARNDMDWMHVNICKYCGSKISYKSNSERIICRHCKKMNYKNKKIEFENLLKKQIMKGNNEKNGK